MRLVEAINLLGNESTNKINVFALLYVKPIPSYMKRSKTIVRIKYANNFFFSPCIYGLNDFYLEDMVTTILN